MRLLHYSDNIPHSDRQCLGDHRRGAAAPCRRRRACSRRSSTPSIPRAGGRSASTRCGTNENAAVHPTALLTIALAEARRAGIVPPPLRGRVDAALRRSVAWLNRGPADGARLVRLSQQRPADGEPRLLGDGDGRDRRCRRSARPATPPRPSSARCGELPPPPEQFASGAYIPLTNGGRFFDDYRHPTSPWIGAAAVMAYRQARRRPALGAAAT